MASNRIVFETSDVETVPLPNEIPEPISVASDTKNSAPGTFESLINQNQDLMNRLNVSLRRNLEMENQFGKLVERNRYLELQAHTLHSEMTTINVRNKELELEFTSLKDQRDSAEKIYAELRADTTEKIDTLSSELNLLKRYQRRIRGYVRPFVEKLQNTIKDDRKNNEKALQENIDLKEKNKDLKNRLGEAYTRIQTQHTERENERTSLVNVYESKVSFYSAEQTRLTQENERLDAQNKDLSRRVQGLIETHGAAENRAIVTERRYEELKGRTDIAIRDLQETVYVQKAEMEKLKAENGALVTSNSNLNQLANDSQAELSRIRDQYEGLQTLWDKGSAEIDELRSRVASLQKLNRELSVALTERRKEVDFLKEQLRRGEEQSNQKIKSVYEHLRNARTPSSPQSFIEDVSKVPPTEMVKKLETLLAEAQTGAVGKIREKLSFDLPTAEEKITTEKHS